MILRGSNISELTAGLRKARTERQRVSGFALIGLDRILEHNPEDMTVTVEAAMTLGNLQSALARTNQWLPLDPPQSEKLTIGALLSANRSGPRRFGHGTVREHLIGIKVLLADGRVIKAGGKVVKNVAGYDLCKLFVGSRGTLGVIIEATFKVLPRPETEKFVHVSCDTFSKASWVIENVSRSNLSPVILDLHGPPLHTVVMGFAGAREDVDWSIGEASRLDFRELSALDYDRLSPADASVRHVSVLPSKVIETIKRLGASEYVARAGNGIIYYRGGLAPARASVPQQLCARIKQTYDPGNVLPDLPW